VNAAGGGERTAFGKAFAANGHKLSSAVKPGKATVGGAAPASGGAPGGTSGGGYYSSITNPHFGEAPAFGYSNALFFRVYP
jgi:hypothetical protein